MAAEHREGCSEVVLTEKDQPAQTLFFNRTNEAFRVSIALGNARGTPNDLHARRLKSLPERVAIFGVAVNDEVRLADRETIHRVNEVTSSLFHPTRVG